MNHFASMDAVLAYAHAQCLMAFSSIDRCMADSFSIEYHGIEWNGMAFRGSDAFMCHSDANA